MKKIMIIFLALLIFLDYSTPFAANPVAVAVDATTGRPMDVLSLVVGSVLFVITLPAVAIAGRVNESANELIMVPIKYTFCRPFGEAYKEEYSCFGMKMAEREEIPEVPEKMPAGKKEEPPVKEEAPVLKEEIPVEKEEAPAIMKEVPAVTKEAPVVMKEIPAVKEEAPVVKEEIPAAMKEAPLAKEEVPTVMKSER